MVVDPGEGTRESIHTYSGPCSTLLNDYTYPISIRHTYLSVSGLVNKPMYPVIDWIMLFLSKGKISKSQIRIIEISSISTA